MIKCALKPVRKFQSLFPAKDGEKTKFGCYMSSHFPIKSYGQTKWIVGTYIDLDYNKYEKKGMELQEIAEECIKFLNTPGLTPTGRRKRKPMHGKFEEKPYQVTLKTDENGKKQISALLIVAARKHKSFWGAGRIIHSSKRRKSKT